MTSTYDNAAKWSQYVDVGLLCTNAACAFQGWFTNMVVMALETDKMFEDASPLAWSDKLVVPTAYFFELRNERELYRMNRFISPCVYNATGAV